MARSPGFRSAPHGAVRSPSATAEPRVLYLLLFLNINIVWAWPYSPLFDFSTIPTTQREILRRNVQTLLELQLKIPSGENLFYANEHRRKNRRNT